MPSTAEQARRKPHSTIDAALALALTLGPLLAAQSGCTRPDVVSGPRPGGRNVSLRYEGSCAHLACRSSYALAVPANTPGAFLCSGSPGLGLTRHLGWFAPAFTCDPRAAHRYRQPFDPPFLACDDAERWLSLPGLTQAECGESYLVCRHGARVLAVARDRSAPNSSGNTHFEGSLGLLRAIGADPEQRDTTVSVYALHERDRIAGDPHCVGSGR